MLKLKNYCAEGSIDMYYVLRNSLSNFPTIFQQGLGAVFARYHFSFYSFW